MLKPVRGGDNRIFSTIRSKYNSMLRDCTKINSQNGKKSRVIKEEEYDVFVEVVMNDNSIDHESKLLVGILCSTGIRITEALTLTVGQINLETNRIRQIEIQKKRLKTLKLDKPIHPAFIEYLKKSIEGKNPESIIVNIENRFIALRRMKKYFGMGCHDFRHSFCNYFLSKNDKQGLERMTKIMGWSSLASSFSYSQNCDLDREIDNFFEVKTKKIAA